MSLTSILKEIDRVNSKQIEVEKRYNRRSKGCLRQEDLRREEQEDHHIFGNSSTTKAIRTHRCSPCSTRQRAPTLTIHGLALLPMLILSSRTTVPRLL